VPLVPSHNCHPVGIEAIEPLQIAIVLKGRAVFCCVLSGNVIPVLVSIEAIVILS
jgi:hypothetical protein